MKPTYEQLEQQLAESQREFRAADATIENLQMKVEKLAAENSYLLNGAARELNTSWMFHKTMLGAQAALVCISRGDIKSARDWLEGTTDEAGADIPDEITVAELQPWFDSQMVSNDGESGFLTREEAEDAIKSRIPATDAVLAEVRASGAEEVASTCRALADRDNCSVNMRCSYNLTAERAEAIAAQLRQGVQS